MNDGTIQVLTHSNEHIVVFSKRCQVFKGSGLSGMRRLASIKLGQSKICHRFLTLTQLT